MRHSNTGKSDPQPAPVKRGFFAAAGERLKRAMAGSRAETASAATLPAPTTQAADGAETEEVTTSVQARARELLTQDRAHKRGPEDEAVESDEVANLEPRPRKTSPPPLPWQRTAADGSATESTPGTSPAETSTAPVEDTTGTQPIVARATRPTVKRAPRDSKSKALRERLGAAKAALAEAQAKRAAETDSQTADSEPGNDVTEPEIILEFLDETPSELRAHESPDSAQLSADALQPSAASTAELPQPVAANAEQTTNIDLQVADATQTAEPGLPPAETNSTQPDLQLTGTSAAPDLQPTAASTAQAPAPQPTAADAEKAKDRPSKPPAAEPIRTLTIARVLARQGYYERSLSIYDALIKDAPEDDELRAEADRVRADNAGD